MNMACYYTPRKQSLGGYIGITLSVRPSIRPSMYLVSATPPNPLKIEIISFVIKRFVLNQLSLSTLEVGNRFNELNHGFLFYQLIAIHVLINDEQIFSNITW
jgi:hypothetical protein